MTALIFTSLASAMSLETYRERIHNQHDWTNRALVNRCRARVSLAAFTKTPLRIVKPSWRGEHVFYAKRKHERAQERGSLCLSSMLMDWYYGSGAKCVREHEGTWTSNTGNGYYGGFQANYTFQQTYGGEYLSRYGTADRWPILAQIHMAYRGHAARGWWPWPTTARICGLL